MSFGAASLLLVVAAVFGGHAVVRRLDPVASLPTHLAWAWLLGQGLVSSGAVLALAGGLPPALGLILPLGVAAAGRRAAGRRKTSDRKPDRSRDVDTVLRGLAVLTGLAALAVVWRSPGLGWDGLAIWGLKARLLAETGQLPIEALAHPSSISMHPEYPLHVPLLGGVLGSLTSALGGDWTDRVLPLLAAADLLAIALLLAAAFETGAGASGRPWRRLLLAGGLLTPIAWRELAEGKADLTLALCLLASSLALCRWLRTRATGAAYLAAAAAGLGAFTKQEGAVWLVLGFAVAAWAAGGRRRALLGPLLLALSIALPWHLFRFAAGLETESFTLSPTQLGRLPTVVAALLAEMAEPGDWGVLWWLAWPVAAWLAWRRWRRPSPSLESASSSAGKSDGTDSGAELAGRFLAGLLAAGFAAIIFIFLATPHELSWHLATALERLVLQWWPVALLMLGAAIETRESSA